MTDRKIDNDQRVGSDSDDRGMIPAETAARKEREGADFKHLPNHEEGLDTEGGYTVDKEGLVNNYAVEPEMYYDTPGDAKEPAKEKINPDETGKLTSEHDERGKGTGVI